MPQKKEADIKHPRRSHPILTAEEARERERQRQRDRRARQRVERAEASSRVVDPALKVPTEEPNSMIILNIGREREREPTQEGTKIKEQTPPFQSATRQHQDRYGASNSFEKDLQMQHSPRAISYLILALRMALEEEGATTMTS